MKLILLIDFFLQQLTDLGHSKSIDFYNNRGKYTNKIGYSAPESITCEKYSCTVDYWSLGIVVYEVICGSKPFVPNMPLAQWILNVREKKSDHINIYEDNAENIIYSNQISEENQLSSELSKLLSIWFKLALELNPKQRGSVFERSSKEAAPVQVLKFFETAESILEKKILTIFMLTNHKYLSIEVTDETENCDLFALIEREANIAASQCHVITPIEENSIKKWKKPIDLYINNYFDRPMIFISNIDHITSTLTLNNRVDDDAIALNIPKTVQNVLNDNEKRLKVHYLKKFARDTLYFIQNENKMFKWCLDGLYNFAMQLNYEIDACQQNVKQMQMLIYGVVGFIDVLKQTIEFAQEKQIDFDVICLDEYTKIAQNSNRLTNACDKITIRYSSLNRRIREINHNEFLLKRINDFYDIINVTKAYDLLQKQILNNNIPTKAHFELFQCAYKCLKQRETYLRNKPFNELKR